MLGDKFGSSPDWCLILVFYYYAQTIKEQNLNNNSYEMPQMAYLVQWNNKKKTNVFLSMAEKFQIISLKKSANSNLDLKSNLQGWCTQVIKVFR